MQFRKVVFIDEENTCLSPFAEGLFRKKANDAEVKLQISSRGTVVLFSEPVSQKVALIASDYGFSLDGYYARALTPADYENDTLLLALDNASRKRAFAIQSSVANVFTLKEYVGENGDIRLPVGEPAEKYEATCKVLDRLLTLLLEKISQGTEE